MDSFRNRLLALIIGLVVATQSVTLVAVLYSTAHEARVRADERLRYGSRVVQQYLRLRADELSGTVAVMATDFGFKEAVASHDAGDHALRRGQSRRARGLGRHRLPGCRWQATRVQLPVCHRRMR